VSVPYRRILRKATGESTGRNSRISRASLAAPPVRAKVGTFEQTDCCRLTPVDTRCAPLDEIIGMLVSTINPLEKRQK